jgi:hypothetical protein
MALKELHLANNAIKVWVTSVLIYSLCVLSSYAVMYFNSTDVNATFLLFTVSMYEGMYACVHVYVDLYVCMCLLRFVLMYCK